ncbi:MAG: hypothetical protein VW982_03235 [Candidatus Poseidoniales archaeon]
MFRWKPPGHWLEPSRKALARSFEFLQDIANGSPQMSIEVNDQSLPRVIVQGASRRWYRINTRAYSLEEYMEVEGEYREVEEVHWNIGISAGAWKKDLVDNTDHSVSLCINPRHESRGLPVGDQVAALALALQNDKITAMRIPLLAQFIVSPREALRDVYQFSEEGVVMEDDLHMEEYDEPEDEGYDDLAHIFPDWPSIIAVEMRAFEHQASEIENRQLDSWMDQQEKKATGEENSPWHHDEQRIWQLEDDLLKGRR